MFISPLSPSFIFENDRGQSWYVCGRVRYVRERQLRALSLFVLAEIVMMGRLMVMVRCSVVVSGRLMVMLTRWMLQYLCHFSLTPP